MRTIFARMPFQPSLFWICLCVFFVTLVVAGGASNGDAAGQVIVRAMAWAILTITALFSSRLTLGFARPVALLLAAAIALTVVQLVPLPPPLWSALPGRSIFLQAAALSGQPQPWRPWSIVPDATLNALQSLVVPVTMLVLMCGMTSAERARLPGLLLCIVLVSAILGLLELSGAGISNPFINDEPGIISGPFANRNHFALFLALGCLLIPGWVFSGRRSPGWRATAGLGLLLLFTLMILATGSRAGIGTGILAIIAAMALAWNNVGQSLQRGPRWVRPVLIAGVASLVLAFVAISVAADRAASVSRVFAIDPGQDMRGKALPTVLDMIASYFPFGSGLGGFDPVFRLHEPFGLLKLTYFNHAHDDFIEIVLDAGLPGLLLIVASLGWWAFASARAWRGFATRLLLPRLGSAMILLMALGSIIDYPLRTPIMMAVLIVAAVWLNAGAASAHPSALPKDG